MKSSFTYNVDGKVLFIEDLNAGGKSVTNDMENVLERIEAEGGLSVSAFDVIYRDSEGIIDGIHTKQGKFEGFYHIGETDFNEAIKKIR